MKFFQYWARGTADAQAADGSSFPWHAHAGSDQSLEDARRRAQELARDLADRWSRGTLSRLSRHRREYYGDRPFREEVLQRLDGDDAQRAVITRNSYGSRVLNVADVFIADLDLPSGGVGGLFRRLFGKGDAGDAIVTRVKQVTDRHPGLGLRLYRTCAGFRAVAVNRCFAPESVESRALLEELQSDPLYVRLCQVQQCYRARVSPKPWRCGLPRPPHRFPFASEEQERAYRTWEVAFDGAVQEYATCALVADFGPTQRNAGVDRVLQVHDRLTLREGAPLR